MSAFGQVTDVLVKISLGDLPEFAVLLEPELSVHHLVNAEEGVEQLAPARAEQAPDAEDLAPVKLKAEVFGQLLAGDVLRLENHVFQSDFTVMDTAFDLVAQHHFNQLLFVDIPDLSLADNLAVSQHNNIVTQIKDLIQEVRDIEDDVALLPQFADHLEQHGDLMVGERGSRLVKQEDAAALTQRTCNLDDLLVADGESEHRCLHIDMAVKCVEIYLRFLLHGFEVKAEALLFSPLVQVRRQDVFIHGHRVESLDFLLDKGDTKIRGGFGVCDHDLVAVDNNLAAVIGLVNTAEDVHQRGLAGSVDADDAAYLARLCRE